MQHYKSFIFGFVLIVCVTEKLFGVLAVNDCSACSVPLVKCSDGKIRGKVLKTREGRGIFAYLGIPFAKPPVGELRFKPPVAFGRWNGTLNATKIHPICPQRDIYRRSEIFEGEEDCLYLNVYSPQLHMNKHGPPLPVMVFFHGGGWLCGGGNTMWYGPDIMLDGDVILVVTNYRLGALGFLSTGDEIVPGNNGLKDQNLALKWIQRNIKYFGGNPKSVTIFGESAGGASVHYHMMSPMSRDLFHKGIAMSGTSLCIWASAPKNEGVYNSKKLAESFDCPIDSSKEMVECLRQVDAMDIVKRDVIFMISYSNGIFPDSWLPAHVPTACPQEGFLCLPILFPNILTSREHLCIRFKEWDFDPMIPFKPTIEPNVEGAFLTEHPVDVVKSGKSAPVPLIVGITSEDGALRGAAILNNDHILDELNKNFKRVVPISLMYDKTAPNISKATKDIKKYYFNDEKIDWSKKKEFINMYTDGWFLNCADEAVRLHRNHTKHPVYYYLFAHRGVASFTEIFGGGDKNYGVCHADDLQYLFPVGDGLFPHKKPSNDDKYVAKLFTTLFTNFAHKGHPTPDVSEIVPEKWHPVKSDAMEYYRIDAHSLGMRRGLFLERAKFWRNLNSNPRSQNITRTQKDEL